MSNSTIDAQVASAKAYEALFVPAMFGQWASRVADAAGLVAGGSVLDVACGTGSWLAKPSFERVQTVTSPAWIPASGCWPLQRNSRPPWTGDRVQPRQCRRTSSRPGRHCRSWRRSISRPSLRSRSSWRCLPSCSAPAPVRRMIAVHVQVGSARQANRGQLELSTRWLN